MKKIVLYAAAASLLAAVTQAQNENVTWLAPANISGASDVSLQGTYFGTWAPYDGNANNLPVNGVHFLSGSDLPGFSANFPQNDQNGYNGYNNPGTPNSNYNTLLQTAAYAGSGNGTIVMSWTDIPGHTYLIEVWANDGRGNGRSETITGGANTSANLVFGNAPGNYIIGTYVADSSGSETITLTGSSPGQGNVPQINLLMIRDITQGTITWQAPAGISGDSDVSMQGTYFGSWAPYDGNASSEPVNGVTFQGNSDLPDFNNTGFNNGYNAYPGSPSGSANYNAVLAYGAYDSPGQPYATFSWGGMTPGHTYQVQIWDNTGNSGRTDTFSGISADSVSVNEAGNYVIGTFVATDTQESITENGPFPNINLLQVRDLTAPAVVTNYQSSVLADKPLGYWPLDLTDANAASGIATDLSGNGNNGSYNNISSGNLAAGPTPYITNAASFNDAEVDLSNPTLFDFGGPITMEAWVQPASPTVGSSPAADILAKGPDGSYNDNEITLRANGGNYYGGRFDFADNGANAQGGQETTNWTYVVCTYDGTDWNLYVNSQLVGHSADSVGALEWPDYWAIGNGTTANGNNRLFQGNICQVALYNYSLTPAQILKHYYEAELNASANSSVPIIQTQPQAQGSYVGGTVTFSVTAVSALPITNLWFQGSTPLTGQTNLTLTLTNLQLGNAGNYRVVLGNANGTTNSAVANLSVAVPNNLEWSANNNNGTWDTTSLDWLNQSNNNQTNFNQGDQVLFNDTPSVPTAVTVSGTLFPSLIIVNTSVNSFNISSGTISGSGSLLKEGTSALSITSSGGLSGTATIGGGSFYAGNTCLGSISGITVSNSATLDFAGGSINSSLKPTTVSGTGVNGEGALYNSYDDYPSELLNITLAGDTSFGGANRWDLAGGSRLSGPHNLTLDWSSDVADGHYGQWNSVVISNNVLGITVTNSQTATATNALGFTGMDSAFQNPATVVTVSSNAQLVYYSGGFNGSIHLQGGATLYHYTAPSGFYGSTITLDTGSSFQSFDNSGQTTPIDNAVIFNGVAHIVIGDHYLVFTNILSGPGGFVEDYYNNAMQFSASNTYTGPTIIGSSGNSPIVALTGNGSIQHSSLIFFGGNDPTVGHIDVTGRPDQTLTLASGQTLAGIGGINGSLVVSNGATLTPAGTNTTIGITTGSNPVGAIAASTSITLNGTTVIKLDGTSNDVIEAAANIMYGGTLNLANISGAPLTAGNSFQIFNAATYSGSFSSITPATPGSGLTWNTSQLSSGIISVVGGPNGPVVGSAKVAGGNFIFSGSGGVTNGTYYVLTSTNLLTPLPGWTPIATNMYDGSGNFSVTNPLSASNHQRFYIIKQ